jgi:lysozyme family protein
MQTNFDISLKYVRSSEGGNSDDPADHGGRTSRGITQNEYNAWCEEKGKPPTDVWNAPDTDIDAIYHEEYWEPICDLLPIGIDYLYFDMAVNSGPREASLLLQRALSVTADGRIGPLTRQAIRKASASRLVVDFSDQKRAFYKNLHQPKFIRGWLNRTDEVEKHALAMLAG